MTHPNLGSVFKRCVGLWCLSTSGKAPEDRRALNELCEQDYEPVLGFLPFRLGGKDKAREAAQGFFAKVLADSGFSGASLNRG